MSYLSNFERSFSEHTLVLLRDYSGLFDATMLVNSLLGLIVVPQQTALDAIPDDPFARLSEWGIKGDSIKNAGCPRPKNLQPETIRGLVINLRHAVAHFRIEPVYESDNVVAFKYQNDTGFEAVLSLVEIRLFVEKLASHLSAQ